MVTKAQLMEGAALGLIEVGSRQKGAHGRNKKYGQERYPARNPQPQRNHVKEDAMDKDQQEQQDTGRGPNARSPFPRDKNVDPFTALAERTLTLAENNAVAITAAASMTEKCFAGLGVINHLIEGTEKEPGMREHVTNMRKHVTRLADQLAYEESTEGAIWNGAQTVFWSAGGFIVGKLVWDWYMTGRAAPVAMEPAVPIKR